VSSHVDRIELAAAVLLACAAVATAWSSYQASRWNGEQAKTASMVNKTRVLAARADNLATSQTQVDIATFIQWVDAYSTQEHQLASFYRERFRPEFKPAFDAWLKTRPLKNPGAPPTPFAMPQYRLAANGEAARLDAREALLAAEVRTNIQRSTNYVLGVVLCAVALFFAGISTKLASRRIRIAVVGLGWAVFVVALTWIATSPVSIAI
jgi:hypothetical protein